MIKIFLFNVAKLYQKFENQNTSMDHLYYAHYTPRNLDLHIMAGFRMLETIPEEREDLFNESFDVAMSEKTIETEVEQNILPYLPFEDENNKEAYEKGRNKATVRLLKSFCKQRENNITQQVGSQLTNYVAILNKVMIKFANAKAELSRLVTYKETIPGLLITFPTAPFKIALFDKQLEKTWVNATIPICKIFLTNYVTKLLACLNQYYLMLSKITSVPTLLDLLTDQTVLTQYIDSITKTLVTDMKILFKTRPLSNVPGIQCIDQFNQMYNINIILANLT